MIPDFAPIPGCTGYYAGSDGHVYSCNVGNRMKRMKGTPDKDGYLRVGIYYPDGSHRNILVHRVIADAFLEPNGKPHVNHLNNNPEDNAPSNLEWVTPKENIEHCVKSGRKPVGESHYKSVFKVSDIRRIRNGGERMVDLAEAYGVAYDTIKSIRYGYSWKHVV